MPRSTLLFGTCLVLAGTALSWYWLQPAARTAQQAPATPPATSALPQPAVPSEQPPTSEQLQLLAAPQVRKQQQRLAFHNRYRDFIERAAELDAAARAAEVRDLEQGIETLEQQGELALSEALLLQLALIKADTQDEAAQKARGEALIRRYQALSAEREAAQAQRPDPQFERYKAEERRIVEEVMALQNVPDGLSRDQYLRQRLQEARERSYQ
ncbi:hypothetical protein L1F06_010710 [Ectopseudomonas hydrolytica]|uniref:Lipase modulator n=1 Tax=Ectopseudomonas hydrolytica TaxID=2493633 RepID=A0ABY5AD85_9GAMM|nr:hypothetical protein [Pseudomonas hydrolytica]USR41864.1 hypothetical protein L1F06_010710 [Pseudomonas hydrolytica]